jgi:hypothetical protein
MRSSSLFASSASAAALAAVVCLGACVGACGADPPPPRVCTWSLPAACPQPAPSYSRDVDPLLTQHCRPCHRPGGVSATVMLGSYAQVFAQRTHVLTQTFSCKMPPPPEAGLSDADAQLLFAWLICNAPDN